MHVWKTFRIPQVCRVSRFGTPARIATILTGTKRADKGAKNKSELKGY